MEISLCMIVKNEEQNLNECLNNIKGYVDEIIIVDTGSTDTTKEIAKKYTDKVYDFKWCDDFAKARNFSLKKASYDWVLVLDADETVTMFNKESIEQKIKKDLAIVGRIKIINPFEDGKEVKKYIERVNRFFNRKYYCYEGIIHEQIVSNNGSKYSTVDIDIETYHIGYLDETVSSTKKLQRNIDLLKNSIKNNPNDSYLYYQIGKSYFKNKDYEKACKNFEKSLEILSNFKLEYTEDLIESYGYALLKCEKYSQAIETEQYEIYYNYSPDYNFVMGLIYMNNGKFKKAIDYFKKCIGKSEGKIEGINSYQPNYNIGVIYETLGFREEGLRYYKKCEDYFLAKERVESILKQKNNIEGDSYKEIIKELIQSEKLVEAEDIINIAMDISEDVDIYSMLSVVNIMQNDFKKAELTLKESILKFGNDSDILYNLGYLYEIQNNVRLAIKYYNQVLDNTEDEELINSVKNALKSLE